MSTFKLKVYGRVVKFATKSMAQAVFARDKHVEHLRAKAKERMAGKRANERTARDTVSVFWRGVEHGQSRAYTMTSSRPLRVVA